MVVDLDVVYLSEESKVLDRLSDILNKDESEFYDEKLDDVYQAPAL